MSPSSWDLRVPPGCLDSRLAARPELDQADRAPISKRVATPVPPRVDPAGAADASVRLVLRPGQRGTKALCAQHGDALVAVRYRYDPVHRVRYKTVELVVEAVAWQSRRTAHPDPQVEILALERHSIDAVQRAGGTFNPAHGLWNLSLKRVRALQLTHRIVEAEHEPALASRSAGT